MEKCVATIDYGSGNLRSVAKALERAAADAQSGHEICVTADPAAVLAADRIVLPGVGAFGDCMQGLRSIPGMTDALDERVRVQAAPFLGICVGMQLLATRGLEFGEHKGLGWIEGVVEGIADDAMGLKVPHMGWNDLHILQPHPLLSGIEEGENMYFVHSYAVRCANTGDVVATTEYGSPLAAMVGRDNIAGVQFHPEKSQRAGLRLLTNFLHWRAS